MTGVYVLVSEQTADLQLAESSLREDFVLEGFLDLLYGHVPTKA